MPEDEKTEEPTPKKLEKARAEGNVAKSMEVSGASVLLSGSIYLLFFSNYLIEQIKTIMLYAFSYVYSNDIPFFSVIKKVIGLSLEALVPILSIIIVIAIISNLAQFGFITAPLSIKFEKIDPIAGAKNLFSFKKVLEYLKLSAKLFIIFVVMCILFVVNYDFILSIMNSSLKIALDDIFLLLVYFLFTALLIIAIFALLDFYFIRYYYMQKQKMSKQEIKDEYKQSEGDPLVKQRVRKIQAQLAQSSILANTKNADVVVTNPTHYAIALRYNKGDEAPMVVAKGVNLIALKMREIASEYDIPIIPNPPLARALYEQVEQDVTIPQDFFALVGAIFREVDEINAKKGKKSRWR